MLLSLSLVSKEYDNKQLLDQVDFSVENFSKIGIIGRNGCGKSTLFRLLAQMDSPDSGKLHIQKGVTVGYMAQNIELNSDRSVYEEARLAFGKTGRMLVEYEKISLKLEGENLSNIDELLEEQAKLQVELDKSGGWDIDYRIKDVMGKVGLGNKLVKSLSGGEKRKFQIAQLFFTQSDLLLLDEPTNHLDIKTVETLETMIKEYKGAVLLITHDRYFLERVVDSIIELDRGKLTVFKGNYERYLQKKGEMLANEQVVEAKFKKLLASEEAWLRKGVKARRTRDEGRVRRLHRMRDEKLQIKDTEQDMVLETAISKRPGKKIITAKNISKSYDGTSLFNKLDLCLRAGEKLALIGPNGVGKTTLLKILTEELASDTGTVKWGASSQYAYFKQDRVFFDPETTILQEVGKGREFVEVNGKSKHIYSYMQNFLFRPEQLPRPIKYLSGGEKNRIALANLFLETANLLILDEPTNDLDIPSLQVLEETLADFPGSVIIVSHDRFFMDKVATRSLLFDGKGKIYDIMGGYQESVEFLESQNLEKEASKKVKLEKKSVSRKKKLTYKEEKELASIEVEIEELEELVGKSEKILLDSELFSNNPKKFNQTMEQLSSSQRRLDILMERWEELEQKKIYE